MARKLKDILEMRFSSNDTVNKNVEDRTQEAQLKRAAATKSTAGVKGGIGTPSGINDAPSGTDRGFNDLMKDDESRDALTNFMNRSSPLGQALSKKFEAPSKLPDIGPKDNKGPQSTRTSQTKIEFNKKKQTPW